MHYCKSLEMNIHTRGPYHLEVISIYNNLALLCIKQNRIEEATTWLGRALAAEQESLDPLHPAVIDSHHAFVKIYMEGGQYDWAEHLLLEILVTRELAGSENSNAHTLNDLAKVYHLKGKYREAESIYLDAIAMGEEEHGEEAVIVAQSLEGLAVHYQNLGKILQAASFCEKALDIKVKALSTEHPGIERTRVLLNRIHRLLIRNQTDSDKLGRNTRH